MPDFYQMLFGSPSPGRAAPRRQLKYATNDPTPARVRAQSEVESYLRYPEGRPDVIPGRPPPTREMRRPPSHVYSDPGSDTPVAPTPLSALTGIARAPLAPAAIEPYGDDFATWYDGAQRGNAGAIPDFASDTPETPDGRAPRNPDNVIDDATGRLSNDYVATRAPPRAEAHYRSRGNIRLSQPTFDPVQEAPPEAFVPVEAPPEFNPTQEWIGAEERAAERWRRGEPNAVDLVFAAIFGNRGQRARTERELEQMRYEVRNNGAATNPEGGGGW